MAVSQKQIAEKLGVSITLVSRVLSGKAAEIGIAAQTIDRVLKTAEELGYVPSAAALSLKGKSTRTIGVAVYDFNDPFFGTLIQQIQIQAHEHNYSLILAGFLNSTPDEQDLRSLHKHALDGLIIIGSDLNADWLKSFHHLPVARIGHGAPEEHSVKITVDEDHAARQIIQHLAALGRKNITSISGTLPSHRLRNAAIKKAADDAGIPLTALISKEKKSFSAGQKSTEEILLSAPQTDALICITDRIAMGALHALNDAGIPVPQQVCVTGFDDIPTAVQFIPPITTMRQPIAEMVKTAVEALIEKEAPAEILLPAELIIRKSSRL